ncbi:hypothetical protein JMJ77_0015167 [Colletotrichum scovillei]|uniref:Uncharacterized protein n=1 Tax=Colletotrichum scovillei TaxID=1209932 RepID=A0A9P7R016_9PEZI|nr:hypothetical protein JMJ77_0015167 [Colletotrichum scovillei]KAG7056823.1 hypothetical protein JMJ78_0000613 [Colletotrichum scovillei]KAG7066717.1 hypothetical protein JMJ76_0000569 [Colletotrichum scovillei]
MSLVPPQANGRSLRFVLWLAGTTEMPRLTKSRLVPAERPIFYFLQRSCHSNSNVSRASNPARRQDNWILQEKSLGASVWHVSSIVQHGFEAWIGTRYQSTAIRNHKGLIKTFLRLRGCCVFAYYLTNHEHTVAGASKTPAEPSNRELTVEEGPSRMKADELLASADHFRVSRIGQSTCSLDDINGPSITSPPFDRLVCPPLVQMALREALGAVLTEHLRVA